MPLEDPFRLSAEQPQTVLHMPGYLRRGGWKRLCSMTFPGNEVKLTGLYFPQSNFLPFLQVCGTSVFLQSFFCTSHDLKSDGDDREQPCNISQFPQHPQMLNLYMFNVLMCALILSSLTVGRASSHRLCSLAQDLGFQRADLSTEIPGKKGTDCLSLSYIPHHWCTEFLYPASHWILPTR